MANHFTLTPHWVSIIEVLRRLAKNRDDRENQEKLPADPENRRQQMQAHGDDMERPL